MLTASAAYKAVLRDSHIARSRVNAKTRDEFGVRTPLGTLPVEGGSLEIDSRGDVWRTARFTVANEEFDSTGARWSDVLEPFTTDVTVEYGVQLTYDWDSLESDWEYVKVATLRIDAVRRIGDGSLLAVEASDDGSRLSEFEIAEPWPGWGGDDLDRVTVDTIKRFVEECYPEDDPVTWVIGAGVPLGRKWAAGSVFQGSRWDAVRTLSEAIGCWTHVDEAGRWVIERLPEIGSPVWEFDRASEESTVTRLENDLDRDEIYNRVLVRYELPFAGSFTATATDTSPTSPTRWGGPMGYKPIVKDLDVLEDPASSGTADADAQDAADRLLAQYVGRGKAITLSAVYQPLLVPGDSITIRTWAGGTEMHLVDSLSLPLLPGEMNLATRLVGSE